MLLGVELHPFLFNLNFCYVLCLPPHFPIPKRGKEQCSHACPLLICLRPKVSSFGGLILFEFKATLFRKSRCLRICQRANE